MKMPDLFCSYSNRDRRDVEAVARQLTERGVDVYMDRWFLQPGQPWPQLLENVLGDIRSVAVFIGRTGLGPWQQREAYYALDRQTRDPTHSVIPVLLPRAEPALGFLALNTWIDLREGLDDPEAIERLAAVGRGESITSESSVPADRSTVQMSPYRGLRPFREEDAPLFFGREAFIETLVDAVQRQSLVSVVGPSGSGKSSVVMAGLIPRLRDDDEHVWEIATVVPGQRPMHAIAAELLSAADPELAVVDGLVEVGRLAELLENGSLAIRDLVDRVLDTQPGTDRLMLVIDQWEELYTLAGDRALVAAFIDGMLDCADHPDVSVVMTMRGDFYGDALRHRALADQLQTGVVNISTMTRAELSSAVNGPAQFANLDFESGLVDRILDDVGDEPGNLPLLEFVLDELWKVRV